VPGGGGLALKKPLYRHPIIMFLPWPGHIYHRYSIRLAFPGRMRSVLAALAQHRRDQCPPNLRALVATDEIMASSRVGPISCPWFAAANLLLRPSAGVLACSMMFQPTNL